MNKLEFRLLRPEEVEVRIASISKKGDGVTLLIYKDARVDQTILDETVGIYNWQRRHTRDNHNCIVSIWDEDKKQWIEKEDVGTESNTESEKGLASDSFKRACFNLGIGRELYTAPFIYFSNKEAVIDEKSKRCFDRFICTDIKYNDKKIESIKILDTNTDVEKTFTNKRNTPAAETKKKVQKKVEQKKQEREDKSEAKLREEEQKQELINQLTALVTNNEENTKIFQDYVLKRKLSKGDMTIEHYEEIIKLIEG